MKMRKTIVSLIAASLLFTACGGGGGDGDGGNGGNDTTKPKITSKPVTKLNGTEFDIVSGQRKVVAIPLDEQIVWDKDGTSLYEFEKIDNKGGVARIDRGNFGFVTFMHDGTSSDGEVTLVAKRDGFTSDPIVLKFKVVDPATAQESKVIKTGQKNDENPSGVERVFIQDANGNIKDPFGLTWLDNADALTDTVTYTEAKKYCEDDVLGDFRLPTEDEMYNIINYGKDTASDTNDATILVDDEFDKKLSYSWAVEDRDSNKKVVISTTTGMRGDMVDSSPFRCVEGNTADIKHLIYTDNKGVTYDASTKLQWTKIEEAKTYQDAINICQTKGTGWRVPTINELRSLIDNGSITPAIHNGQYTILSSTPAIIKGVKYHYGLETNWFKNEKPTIGLFLQESAVINGTSYDPQTAGITCVK